MPENSLNLYDVVKALALPPGSLLVILFLGILLLAAGRRRLGFLVTFLGVLVFYLLATPIVASRLGAAAQTTTVALQKQQFLASDAQAIVVLAAGLWPNAPEYGGGTIDEVTLQRLAYAAYLWRQRNLPILVSGGNSREAAGSLAQLMKKSLEESFGVPVEWVEDKSGDTYENAQFSAEILHRADVSRIILVTHASHMPRAAELFRTAGLTVTPAPTAFSGSSHSYVGVYLPRQSALSTSYTAIYELLGNVWYEMRGKLKKPEKT